MKKMLFVYVQTLLLCFLSIGCEKDIEPRTQPTLSEKYEACCGFNPVEFNVKDSYVFVPNVFVTEQEGNIKKNPKHKIFKPYLSEDIKGIGYMEIGMETDSGFTIIYQVKDIDIESLDKLAWNGLIHDTGKLYSGPFSYQMLFVAKNDNAFALRGQACAIPCNSKDRGLLNKKESCFYPEQFDPKSRKLNKKAKKIKANCS